MVSALALGIPHLIWIPITTNRHPMFEMLFRCVAGLALLASPTAQNQLGNSLTPVASSHPALAFHELSLASMVSHTWIPFAGLSAPTSLVAGAQTFDLPTSGTTATFEFKNDTQKTLYDFLLSTQESSGFDPDFQGGPVTITKSGVNLGWGTNVAPADGVEDIKVMVPGIGTINPPDANKAIKPGEVFTLDFTSVDGFSSGDKWTVTPTTLLKTTGAGHFGVVA